MGYNPAIPGDHAVQPATPAIRYLQAQRPARFAGLTYRRRRARQPADPERRDALPALRRARLRLPDRSRYYRVWSRAIAGCLAYQGCPMSVTAKPSAFRALGLLGVTRLLQNPGDTPIRGLQVAYYRPDARIYSNPSALPRAFLVDHQTVVPDDKQALAAVTSPQFRRAPTAITEKPLAGLAQTPARRRPPPGNARIASYQPEHVDIQTDSTATRCSCSPTTASRAGRPRSTAKTRPSSASTTCSAASRPRRRPPDRIPLPTRQLARRLDHQHPHTARPNRDPLTAIRRHDRPPPPRPPPRIVKRTYTWLAGGRRWRRRCCMRCCRWRCSRPGWCRGGRCRRPTTSGRPRPGRRSGRPRSPVLGSNRDLPDAAVRVQPFAAVHPRGAAGRAALEPVHHRAGGRSWPTRSRRCSRRSACPPTCCRSGTRWRGSRR